MSQHKQGLDFMQAGVLKHLWSKAVEVIQQRKCHIKMSDRRREPEARGGWRRQKVCTQEEVSPRSRRDVGKWQLSQVTRRIEVVMGF